MYNDLMPNSSYEIRRCESCGLRYPLVEGHPFGRRCPACMGETRVILRRPLRKEPTQNKIGKKQIREQSIAVLLDNIRSAWNVGSILRSADGFAFMHAYLCGITPTADNEAVTKTSLGAEDSVPWSYHKDAVKLVNDLKVEGWTIYGLEEDRRGRPITRASSEGFNALAPKPSARREVLVVGNEVTGVDPELLDLCDEILHIPMRGEKKSFNVAIAFGIAAYALTYQTIDS